MSRFASRKNSVSEEEAILDELVTLLGAVDVTGFSAWERAVKVYGGLAEGDSLLPGVRVAPELPGPGVPPAGRPGKADRRSPSASPVVQHLFTEEAA